MFQSHPSEVLQDLYRSKNYQCANPSEANVIFVGRDPNWSLNIQDEFLLQNIIEYLKDGTSYWKKYGIHHPFLLPTYKGDGKRYHTMFSKLKIDRQQADKISFVELIGFPTSGMASKNKRLFDNFLFSVENQSHLIELDEILKDKGKTIFIAWGLLNDFKKINKTMGIFSKIAEIDKTKLDITDLNTIDNIMIHKHFSDSISNLTISKISTKVKEHIK